MKTGVKIRGDCTCLRKYLGINTCGTFVLRHLYKLIKCCHTSPNLINIYHVRVRLADQVQEHLGLPLAKKLTYGAVIGESTSRRAGSLRRCRCLCRLSLICDHDAKRTALDHVPPLPAHDELYLSIRIRTSPYRSRNLVLLIGVLTSPESK
ncbi:hypothetical protein BDW66DRAFT_91734 [Aspergillus desertorum]